MDKPQGIEEILAMFGNADYSPEFWRKVNAQRREESEAYERALIEEAAAAHSHLQRKFGPIL